MQYLNYERDIVLRYGVVLEGWTHSLWANPSELSTSLEPLRQLVDALKSGSCKFVKLTREDWEKRRKEYYAKIDSGEIRSRERKKRSDAGKKRKARDMDDSSSDDDDEPATQQGTPTAPLAPMMHGDEPSAVQQGTPTAPLAPTMHGDEPSAMQQGTPTAPLAPLMHGDEPSAMQQGTPTAPLAPTTGQNTELHQAGGELDQVTRVPKQRASSRKRKATKKSQAHATDENADPTHPKKRRRGTKKSAVMVEDA